MITPRKKSGYGWNPPRPELSLLPPKYSEKNLFTDSGQAVVEILPQYVDLRKTLKMPEIYDQGGEASCTANAGARAIETELLRQGLTDFMPSRNYIYYNSRALEGNQDVDSGASLADTVKALASEGACRETTWIYGNGTMLTKPSPIAYAEGLQTKALTFKKVFNTISPSLMKLCLSEGNPFIFGFSVYQSFESPQVAKTGIVPMPQPNEMLMGGHAVFALAYDDIGAIAPQKEMVLCANSWGINWGLGGYFWIPYAYLTNNNLAADFWTIESVT